LVLVDADDIALPQDRATLQLDDGLPALVRWNRIIKLMKAMRPRWHPAGGAWGR
jgi:hypothetical protein